jgi:hypothetical protein
MTPSTLTPELAYVFKPQTRACRPGAPGVPRGPRRGRPLHPTTPPHPTPTPGMRRSGPWPPSPEPQTPHARVQAHLVHRACLCRSAVATAKAAKAAKTSASDGLAHVAGGPEAAQVGPDFYYLLSVSRVLETVNHQNIDFPIRGRPK